MLKLFRGSRTQHALEADSEYILKALREHHTRLVTLEAEKVTREAEHLAQLDALQRLYRRMAARIARESPTIDELEPEQGPTPLELRRALRGR